MKKRFVRYHVLFIVLCVLLLSFFPPDSNAGIMFRFFGGASTLQFGEAETRQLLGGAALGLSFFPVLQLEFGGLFSNYQNEKIVFAGITLWLIDMNHLHLGISGNVDFHLSNFKYKQLRPEAVFLYHFISVGDPIEWDYEVLLVALEGRVGMSNNKPYATLGITIFINLF